MNTAWMKGIIVPIVTPIKDDESVDETSLREHIDFLIDQGIDGILAFGSNSEFYMQTEEEMRTNLAIIINQVRERIPVYMGIGAIRTSTCIALARMGLYMGCRAIAVLQPMFVKLTNDELYTHFSSIAAAIGDKPMLLYNNPGRTGYDIPSEVVAKLAHSSPNVVGMKDSSGNMTNTLEFIRRNRDVGFRVFVGKDTLIYSGLTVGCCGAVCSTANFLPTLVCSIWKKFEEGDLAGSLEAQFKLNPIRIQMDKSSFPVATKDYLNLLGGHGTKPYLPSLPSDGQQMAGLRQKLVEGGYLK